MWHRWKWERKEKHTCATHTQKKKKAEYTSGHLTEIFLHVALHCHSASGAGGGRVVTKRRDRQTDHKSCADRGGAGEGVRTQQGLTSLSFLRRGWKHQRALGRTEVEPKSPYLTLQGELARQTATLAFWTTVWKNSVLFLISQLRISLMFLWFLTLPTLVAWHLSWE